MSQNLHDIRPLTGLLMGALFLLPGVMIIFIALDWIEVDPSRFHAPRWVVGVLGGMFALSGLGSLYYGIRNALYGSSEHRSDRQFPVVSWLLGLVIMGGLALTFAWVAFGPGERAFSGSVGIGGVGVGDSAPSELFGRAMFGAVAFLSGMFAIWGLIYGLRKLRSRPGRTER